MLFSPSPPFPPEPNLRDPIVYVVFFLYYAVSLSCCNCWSELKLSHSRRSTVVWILTIGTRLEFDFASKKKKKHHPFFLYFACKIRFYFCGWWCFGLYFAFQNRPENDFSWCGVNVNEVAILWEPCEVSQVWSCLIPISSTCVYPCACEENGHKSFAFFLQWHWYYRSLSLSYKCSHQSVVCFYVSATEWHIALSSVRVSPLYFCSDSVFLMQVECKA